MRPLELVLLALAVLWFVLPGLTDRRGIRQGVGLLLAMTVPWQLAIEGYTSLSFQSDGPFALRKFQNFLDNQMPAEVFRAKGILWFNESERRHVFHLAGKRFSIDDSDWTGDRKNQLVLIGKEIDHDKLRRQLQACVAKDAGKGFL